MAPAQGQHTPDAVDYITWEELAANADDLIASEAATTKELEDTRRQIIGWRQQFLDMQGLNASAIRTARDQIAALGPVPETGEEAEDIAAQRAELNRRLARLEAPVKLADLARSRAEGLVTNIDAAIRDRQTQALLRLGPSPLNPLHWPVAVKALYRAADIVRAETVTNWQSSFRRNRFQSNLPGVIVLSLIGLLLIARGRTWTTRLTARVLGETPTAARRLGAFATSLGEWLLPYLGVMALVTAAGIAGLLGARGTVVIESLPAAAVILLLARWLTQRVFPRDDRHLPLLALDQAERSSGRLCGASLAYIIAGFAYVQNLADGFDWSEEARNVLIFPLVVLAALLLLRLARLLMRHSKALADEAESDVTLRNKMVRILARALYALAVIAPLLAAIGYMSAAEAMMLPALLSLMMIAALLLIQRVLSEVYIMLRGDAKSIEDSLFPTLLGFFLVLASLPIFALIWGARPAQLNEAWRSFTQGVSFGGITLSPTGFLVLAGVFTLGYLMTRLIQGTLKNSILPKTRLDMGGRNAIVSGVGYVGIFLAALVSITAAGIDLSSLAIVAGALSVGIGFGLQNIVSNFVAGIILLIERPISEGDWIEVGGQHGYVRSISVRSTRIETFDRTDVIVPNADFVSGTVTNYTRGNTVGRVIVPVGVAYGTDTRRVEKILREVAEAHPMVLMQPPPSILFQSFGASSLDFEIRAILRDVNWMASVRSDLHHEIARRFVEEGIEIPFPQQDIWFRSAPPQVRAPRDFEPPASSGGPAALTEGDVDGSGDGDGDGR